ncbi:uncharacterized protein LOC142163173 [Nicotiana tabacum]|uniref:Uncharacterized protein LOC142163173 n=1 Tax=Nicotiana tabacum TaxID=4097 RepID=A0AC58RUX6_TOBAC
MYTWCDNRDPPNTIWKRLDRRAYNSEWFDSFGGTSVTHLSRSYSDHAPSLITCKANNVDFTRYFKFLNIWAEHKDFLDVVQHAWDINVVENSLYILHQKNKNTCNSLHSWSREAFGDIYEELKKLKILIRSLEEASLTNNCPIKRMNLSKARAGFTRYLKLQDNILRHKARVKWLKEGDANTAFFHGSLRIREKD